MSRQPAETLRDARDLPDYHYVERAYPACWWRGSNGVDENAVREFLAPLA